MKVENEFVIDDVKTTSGINTWNFKLDYNDFGKVTDARKDGKRWLIEVKGPGSRQPMRVNYFLGILGEALQRMNDPNARYLIALPDMDQYRRLWNRLPQLAKERATIDLLLINSDGNIHEYK